MAAIKLQFFVQKYFILEMNEIQFNINQYFLFCFYLIKK
jgi:hypothetical protein